MGNFMKENQKNLFFGLTLLLGVSVILLGLPEDIVAQPGLPGDPEQTPIDGGLGILAALGGAYGIKKLREKD